MRHWIFSVLLAILWVGSNIASAQSGCPGVSFSQPSGSPIAVGSLPESIAAGDFDHDGNPDMAIITDSVEILLGDGAGGFSLAPGSSFYAGSDPVAIATADLNGDGILDLAIAHPFEVNVFSGDGSGGFSLLNSLTEVCDDARDILAGDFDRDGDLDLAITNHGTADVSIVLNFGGDGFSSDTRIDLGANANPQGFVAGDFDRDGLLDLATANSGTDNISILLNNGEGFSAASGSPIPAGDQPFSITTGDYDRDGDLDLAATNFTDDNVTILIGDGAGGFSEASGSPVAVSVFPRSIVTGDVNRDGVLDLSITSGIEDNVTILIGDGTGGFSEASGSPISTEEDMSTLTMADFDNDGALDLAVTDDDGDNVLVLLNDCAPECPSPNFSQPSGSPISVGDVPRVITGDFDRDGDLDLATANRNDDNVTILLGDGAGGFSEASGSPISVGLDPFGITTGDFDADGDLDLTTVNNTNGDVTILVGDGAGGFSEASGSPVSAGIEPRVITTGDFDRDGILDLATGDTSSITILIGDGFGGFSPTFGSPISTGVAAFAMTTEDFNRDGILDLATANAGSGNITIMLGDGGGGFSEASGSPIDAGSEPIAIATGDFDEDGDLDLAIPNLQDDNVTILLGDGAGEFSQASGAPVTVGAFPHAIATGDFDRDGDLDLAAANSTGGNVTILLGDGTGEFSQMSGSPFDVPGAPVSMTMGDFDRDGDLDLATANLFNTVSILLNGCGGAIVTEHPLDQTVCTGHQASFSAAATGATSVQWQKSTDAGSTWNDLSGAISSPHSFTAAFADDDARFRAIFSNGGAHDTTDAATLTVNPPPTMSVSLTPATLSRTNTMRTITATISTSGGCSTQVALDSITATENGVAVSLAGDIGSATFGVDDRSFDVNARSTTSGHSRVYTVHYSLVDGAHSESYTRQVVVLWGGGVYTGPGGVITITTPTPNPLTTSTSFNVITTLNCAVRLSVYNLMGMWLTDILGSQMINGTYPVTWNGNNSMGQPLPNGTYILQAKGCNSAATAVIAINR